MDASTLSTVSFDGEMLMRAVEEQRSVRGLRWRGLAVELWDQSAVLNAQLGDDALCPGALQRTAVRGTMSCQYALPLLRWLRRPPEDFLVGEVVDVGDTRLPEAGPDKRLRWDLAELHADLNGRREERALTWAAMGAELVCSPNRLTNLKSAQLADMGLVMQVTQWLAAPASRYVHPTDW
ncbi:hypothetical protein Cch01nite_13770 [Cellulomonas chitinilytica]|uniref:Uncharacterized protein n=1 Tax=Cellulomonas chitinilytica TaxID=398759 RepID=A0A919P2F6_9CELL|nr:hypothetical protein [Cellulomonas chitinilytica]GIG20653.1 hypothetical protein Cch01nite_13770 [Cellulomonas chitinilytica]